MNQIVTQLENKIKEMIDELKGLCQTNGLSNQASEEVVITSVFLYKFLNDKFISNLNEFSETTGMLLETILKNEHQELTVFYNTYPQDVAFKYEDTIECLINKSTNDKFYSLFDDALERISNYPENDEFNIDTADGGRKPLFTRITENVESVKRNNFAKNIFGIISQDKFSFGEAFKNNFDFYSAIFEYLIKDYNVASGVYAEYFTPQVISNTIAKILVNMSPVDDKIYEVYDPAAGSGSLVLHLANELGKGQFGDKALVYTQDISNKSSRFLRINMILNGLTNSLDNIIEGDTLLNPTHFKVLLEPESGLKQFDYITANPPFKTDFSSTRDSIEKRWEDTERFFAGIPKVPSKNKKKMAIYLCFIQHILYSLKDEGKAAIIVPTGFLTAQNGIEKKIKTQLIDNNWLKGVISMPSNIFANTGTNVSVLFIDKSKKSEKVILVDASNMGSKVKKGSNQKTVLSNEEIKKIEDTFIGQEVVDDFSVLVSVDDIKEKNYSFSTGQYFKIKIDYVEVTQEAFNEKINNYKNELDSLFKQNTILEQKIKKNLERLKYDI
jgi:site-specific DNA-methyltransferase (adenine-specific)